MPSAPAKKPAATKPAAAKAAPKPKASPAMAKPKASPAKSRPADEAPAQRAKAETPAASGPAVAVTLRIRDLIARVAEATGAKVKDVKPTVEATLSELGKALDAGEPLNLPPLGRVKITPAKGEASGAPMKLKLHRGSGAGQGGQGRKTSAKEALAEGGEDS